MFGFCRNLTARWSKLHFMRAEAVFENKQILENKQFDRLTQVFLPVTFRHVCQNCILCFFEQKRTFLKQ